jgi:hypothetical protein
MAGGGGARRARADPERLTAGQFTALAGYVGAVALCTPESVPSRRIEAIMQTAEECVAELAARRLDTRRFEWSGNGPLAMPGNFQ